MARANLLTLRIAPLAVFRLFVKGTHLGGQGVGRVEAGEPNAQRGPKAGLVTPQAAKDGHRDPGVTGQVGIVL